MSGAGHAVLRGEVLKDRVPVANPVRPQIPVLGQGVLLVFFICYLLQSNMDK